jgi:hypothetical protein
VVSSTNKTDCHDIAEILLKVALNTITPNPESYSYLDKLCFIIWYKFMYDEMIEVDPYCIRQYNSKSWLFGFFYGPKDLKYFGFERHLMKVIPETRRAQ